MHVLYKLISVLIVTDWSDTVFRRRNVTHRRISNTVLQPRYWGSEADSPEVCRLEISWYIDFFFSIVTYKLISVLIVTKQTKKFDVPWNLFTVWTGSDDRKKRDSMFTLWTGSDNRKKKIDVPWNLQSVIRSSGEEMWRIDAYQIPYYSRGNEGGKRTHPRFADCILYGVSRHWDEWKYIIIERIFEIEIILIPPSLKISENSSNGSYHNTNEVWWRYGISRSCDVFDKQ
jgi:hypothetical protein